MAEQIEELIDLLEKIEQDLTANKDTRAGAKEILNRIMNFEFLALLNFWVKVLRPIDRVQKNFQSSTINFYDSGKDLEALVEHFNNERDTIVDESIRKGLELCEKLNINDTTRSRRQTIPRETNLRRMMIASLDRLQVEIKDRFNRLFDLHKKFGLFMDVEALMYREIPDLEDKCEMVSKYLDTDIDKATLMAEIEDCRMLLKVRSSKLKSASELLNFIISYGDEMVFPNLRTVLQILCTIATSIASCERSFSKLKLIKSYLRASMTEERLNSLAMLSVEHETLEEIDFSDLIDKFAVAKARRINFG